MPKPQKSNNIKAAALYLYEARGRSSHYIAKKLGVDPWTVRSWIAKSTDIRKRRDSDLYDYFLLRADGLIDWFGDDQEQ